MKTYAGQMQKRIIENFAAIGHNEIDIVGGGAKVPRTLGQDARVVSGVVSAA
jgi:hypothetical protein